MKNTPKNPYLIKMPKKILAKFSDLKKSWKQKFQTKNVFQSSPSYEIRITSPGLSVHGR